MRRVTYWVADVKRDNRVYSVRARTRREVYDELRREWGEHWQEQYERPRKVVLEYEDAFDLVDQILSEGFGEESSR